MQLAELAHIIKRQRLAEDGMVRATGEDPRFGGGVEIRQRFPQGIRHRQIRQIVRRFHRFNTVHQQAEAIAEIDQAGVDRRARFGGEDQTRRIGLAADAEILHVQRRFFVESDRRAHFQHMRAEHQVVAILKVIGVILHKGGAAVQAAGHHLHNAQQRCGLPVAFAGKAVALLHQALYRQARQLFQAVQIFKSGGEGVEAALF